MKRDQYLDSICEVLSPIIKNEEAFIKLLESKTIKGETKHYINSTVFGRLQNQLIKTNFPRKYIPDMEFDKDVRITIWIGKDLKMNIYKARKGGKISDLI